MTAARIKRRILIKDQRLTGGYILIPVVLAISLIATIAFIINNESANETNQAGAELDSDRANYIAEAGLALTLWQVQNNACMGDMSIANTPFGSGNYTASISSPATTTNHYSINPDHDTFIDESNPDDIKGNSNIAKIKNEENNNLRALYHFDLSIIPSSELVMSAIAWFYVTVNDPQNLLEVYAINSNWTENTASWANIANNFDPAKFGIISPAQSSGTWVSVNLTHLTQSWINAANTNHGLMLMATTEKVLSELNTNEAGNNYRPRLEITTADSTVSPVQLTSSALISSNHGSGNDLTRTLTNVEVSVYQSPIELILQPDATLGKDTKIYEKEKEWNYGVNPSLDVTNNSGNFNNSLLQFRLGIPIKAQIHKAELVLHQNSTSSLGGLVDVHRVTNSWIEGDVDGKGGKEAEATWKDSKEKQKWINEGGDFSGHSYASTTVEAGLLDWYSWDITELVNDWVSGAYADFGLALIPASNNTEVYFDSSDAADPTMRPKLTITYSCECGSPCLAPGSNGNVLMVVDDDKNLSASEQFKLAYFESWGYKVNLIKDNEKAPKIADAANDNDVIYVSDSIKENDLGSKLADLTIGIISEAGSLNNENGIASNSTSSVGSAINISDNSHYITKVFPTGSLDIYSSPMAQLKVAGSTAPGLQQLADSTGIGTLVILDTGAAMGGDLTGQNAAGPRVMLPTGSENGLNWSYLNNNGLLLVQRAIDWGMRIEAEDEEDPITPKSLLMVVSNIANPSQQIKEKKSLIESWGYIVTMIDESDKQTAFDTAVANNLVAFVPAQIDDGALKSKLVNASLGIVYEKSRLNDEFGMAASYGIDKASTTITITNNLHYITLPFANGPLQVHYRGSDIDYLASTQAANIDLIASSPFGDALVTLKAGDALYAGGVAAGSRVKIPWGDDVYELTEDARTIMRRSLEWAENGDIKPQDPPIKPPTDSSCIGTFRDEFINTSYSANDGTLKWSSDWLEINEKDGVNKGDIQVSIDPHGYWYSQGSQQLLIDNQNKGVMREMDLSGASKAVLSFVYSKVGLDNEADYVSVEIASNGSSGPWKELTRITGPSWDQSYQKFSADISEYISSSTFIRFISAKKNSTYDEVWFDDIEIECASPSRK